MTKEPIVKHEQEVRKEINDFLIKNGIYVKHFAKRTGYSPGHVGNVLSTGSSNETTRLIHKTLSRVLSGLYLYCAASKDKKTFKQCDELIAKVVKLTGIKEADLILDMSTLSKTPATNRCSVESNIDTLHYKVYAELKNYLKHIGFTTTTFELFLEDKDIKFKLAPILREIRDAKSLSKLSYKLDKLIYVLYLMFRSKQYPTMYYHELTDLGNRINTMVDFHILSMVIFKVSDYDPLLGSTRTRQILYDIITDKKLGFDQSKTLKEMGISKTKFYDGWNQYNKKRCLPRLDVYKWVNYLNEKLTEKGMIDTYKVELDNILILNLFPKLPTKNTQTFMEAS